MKRFAIILVIATFGVIGVTGAQDLFDDQSLFEEEDLAEPAPAQKQSSVAIGFNAGVQKPFCDVHHTGIGPAGELMLKLLVSDVFSISFSAGYGQLNDGWIDNTFATNLIAGDLKANVNLVTSGNLCPYIFLGLGIFNYQYNITNSASAIGAPSLDGKRYTDGSFIFGGGMEIMVNPNFAINTFADYRHTTGDGLDGMVRKAKDGYFNARLGFSYYLGAGKISRPEEELLANETLDLAEIDTTESGYDIFEDKLTRLEEAETGNTMEDYIRLKSRVDQLNGLIEQKENEIQQLRASLDYQNQRIADLEDQLVSTTPSSYGTSDEFSKLYEDGLREFYARDYNTAIRTFENIRDKYPTHKLASNCQYWIGESYFGLAAYTDARNAFSRVFDYAFSYKKDDATLMLGRCYYSLGDKATARTYFQSVLDEYPESEYIEKAREWLNRI